MRPTATLLIDCCERQACRGRQWFQGARFIRRLAILKRQVSQIALAGVALLFLISFGSSTSAQTSSDQPFSNQTIRIGFVDMALLFDNAPQLIAARQALDIEFRPRFEALSADEARIEALRTRMQAISDPNSAPRQDLEREIRNLRRSIDRRRADLSQEMRFRTTAEKNAIEDTIQVAIRQVAEQGGFDLVLTGPVAFASDRVDMTDQIIDWLEQDFANSLDAPGSQP